MANSFKEILHLLTLERERLRKTSEVINISWEESNAFLISQFYFLNSEVSET